MDHRPYKNKGVSLSFVWTLRSVFYSPEQSVTFHTQTFTVLLSTLTTFSLSQYFTLSACGPSVILVFMWLARCCRDRAWPIVQLSATICRNATIR